MTQAPIKPRIETDKDMEIALSRLANLDAANRQRALNTEERKTEVLAALLQTPSFAEACTIAGYAVSTGYEWRKKDPDFNQAVEDRIEAALGAVIGKLFKKAMKDDGDAARKLLLQSRLERHGHFVDRQETVQTTVVHHITEVRGIFATIRQQHQPPATATAHALTLDAPSSETEATP